jgi:3-methyladenine DNA glycosylase AlkD
VVEDLLRHSSTWDHVDWLSTKVVGALVQRFDLAQQVLPEWASDGSFWIRRAALLGQVDALRAGGGDFELFARLAVPMLGEREFFIRKAIGWVLREVSKKRPALVHGFLAEHAGRVSALTLREGSKYLPADQQAELRRLQSEGIPTSPHSRVS